MQAVDARLVTPEAVVLQFETAGLGSRFLGRMLDSVIQIAALIAFSFVFFASSGGGGIFIGTHDPGGERGSQRRRITWIGPTCAERNPSDR